MRQTCKYAGGLAMQVLLTAAYNGSLSSRRRAATSSSREVLLFREFML
jgi:hypothetical protein